MTGTLPARVESQTLTPAPRVDLLAIAKQAEAAQQLGKTLIASGLLPDSIKKPEAAVAIMLKGAELDIPPMHALSHIVMVKGKPTMSAELMRALAQRAGHCIRIVESTAERAVVEGIRADDPDHPTRITFDEEDVKRAGLSGQQGHKTYPAAMKLARATSALCRAVFADALAGISYTPEELGAAVDEEGWVVEASGPVDRSGESVEAEVVEDGLTDWERDQQIERATEGQVKDLKALANMLFDEKSVELHGWEWLAGEVGPLEDLPQEKASRMIQKYRDKLEADDGE